MLLQDFLPSPPLRDYVRLIQVIHFVFPAGAALPFKAYPPRPEQCLAFYPRDAESVAYAGGPAAIRLRSVLIGQHTVVSNRYVGREFGGGLIKGDIIIINHYFNAGVMHYPAAAKRTGFAH